jgi:hypothetical protein
LSRAVLAFAALAEALPVAFAAAVGDGSMSIAPSSLAWSGSIVLCWIFVSQTERESASAHV